MEVILYKPFPHQRAVHDAITRHIESVERFTDDFQKSFVVKSCRQVGKSALIENEFLRFCLQYPDSKSAYLAPAFNLCRKLFDEMIKITQDTGLVVSSNSTNLEINFLNGSSLNFFSAEQRDKLRGFTVSGLLAIDEAAFISDSIYFDMVKVWTNAKRAVTLIVSSPDYESGFFYEMHTEGLKGSKYIESFDFIDYDLTALQSKRSLEEAKRTTPPQTYRSEYLGLYRKAQGTVFGDFQGQILQHEPEAPTEMYFGLDWASGSGGDYTVLTAFNHKRQMCYMWRTNEMAPLEQIEYIRKVFDQYKDITKGIIAEQNSIGKIYLDMIKHDYKITAFNTDKHSKRKIIEQMQVDLQNGDVWLMNDRDLKLEFSSYDCKVSGTSTTYSAPTGMHDDIVMSTLLANHCQRKFMHRSTRISII